MGLVVEGFFGMVVEGPLWAFCELPMELTWLLTCFVWAAESHCSFRCLKDRVRVQSRYWAGEKSMGAAEGWIPLALLAVELAFVWGFCNGMWWQVDISSLGLA